MVGIPGHGALAGRFGGGAWRGGGDPIKGDGLTAVEALGVDAQEDFDAVPGPVGALCGATPPLSQVDTAAWRRS